MQTQRCGNGVLDPLEDCDDSGGLFGPKDPCCESKSCKLLPGCACAASQARAAHMGQSMLPLTTRCQACCVNGQVATSGTVSCALLSRLTRASE